MLLNKEGENARCRRGDFFNGEMKAAFLIRLIRRGHC